MKKTKNLLLKVQLLIIAVLSIALSGCMNDVNEGETKYSSEVIFYESGQLERSLTNTGYIQGH